MIVAGFDQAPKGSGWSIGDGASPPARGYQEFGDYGDAEGFLIMEVRSWFKALATAYGFKAIATEQIIIREPRRDKGHWVKQFDAVVLGKQYAVRTSSGSIQSPGKARSFSKVEGAA